MYTGDGPVVDEPINQFEGEHLYTFESVHTYGTDGDRKQTIEWLRL